MIYSKPQIAAMGSTLVVVQAQLKPQTGMFDNLYGPGVTANAYEADE